ncbi:zf-HC2 domain-containing protein [Sulfurirhabdus autotrophica]|uniref:Putative zinc finger protein n=1 Tax=Sulfurirhabdus autotrophica TaxID=1706046 RepID=A0A4R3Y362_9PROT|nr:zf-HC2 domain-containing protein [Sulfurirhabdus autotrophica]TCV85168.1 putative zinc finger protein [Sulfurirhabdus autotrophica]
MLTCKDASKLLSQSFDRNLTLTEKISMKLHLLICNACSKVDQQLAFLHKAGKKLASEPEDIPSSQPGLTPEAQERILEELHRKQDAKSASE